MTKIEAINKQGLSNYVFDYALPQQWVNAVEHHLPDSLKGNVVNNFVWLYDGQYHLFGRPASLSSVGNLILDALTPDLFLHGRYAKGVE